MRTVTLALGVLLPSLVARVTAWAQNSTCTWSEPFVTFNISKTVQLPALQSDGFSLKDDPDETWYFTLRTAYKVANMDNGTSIWLNTGTSDTTGMGSCSDAPETYGGDAYGRDGFEFSRDVIERSVNDKGDCKIMLGEDCVAGLKRHYLAMAIRSATLRDCARNYTVPQECMGLIDGGTQWRGPRQGPLRTLNRVSIALSSDGRLTTVDLPLDDSLDKTSLEFQGCPEDSVALNSSMHGGIGSGLISRYNYTVRFPRPYFLTFWPKRNRHSAAQDVGSDGVRVEILCMRPDDIEEGSPVPPSAQELLNAEDVKYTGNASNVSSGSVGGDSGTGPNDSPDKGDALALKVTAPYLGAAAIAAMLLI
jgi:hypothetical protein